MGHRPRPSSQVRVLKTRYEALRNDYVKGKITLEEFDEFVAILIRYRALDEPCPFHFQHGYDYLRYLPSAAT